MKKVISLVLVTMLLVTCISTTVFAGKTYDEIMTGINPVTSVFKDVPNSFWGASYIKKLKELNILSGKGDGYFDPDGNVTRAEFAKILTLALNLQDEGDATFVDVDANQWYAPYVATVAGKGIAKGYEDGTFKPDAFVTREELATMIVRGVDASKLVAKETEVKIGDMAKVSDWAYENMIVLIGAGVIGGDENSNVNPQNNATRAEVAKIICGIL